MNGPMRGVVTSRDGIPLAFEVHGAGAPAVVLVHGWSCDRSYWDGQVGPLAARYRTVAVDLAGHGESGSGRRAWTMAAFGEDVVAVVEQVGAGRVVLAGHSMGGDVIVEATLRLGDRVAGLVWADVYSTLGDPDSDDELDAFAAPFRDDFVPATRAFVRRMFPPGADPGVIAGLGQLTVPVVAINAEQGHTDTAALRRHGVEPVLMPGVGHFLMMEDPEGFNRLLVNAVEGFSA